MTPITNLREAARRLQVAVDGESSDHELSLAVNGVASALVAYDAEIEKRRKASRFILGVFTVDVDKRYVRCGAHTMCDASSADAETIAAALNEYFGYDGKDVLDEQP